MQRPMEEFFGALGVRGQQMGYYRARRREGGERGEAARLRFVEQRLSVQIEQVEPEGRKRKFGAQAVEIEHGRSVER